MKHRTSRLTQQQDWTALTGILSRMAQQAREAVVRQLHSNFLRQFAPASCSFHVQSALEAVVRQLHGNFPWQHAP
jgi:hypothetical protein